MKCLQHARQEKAAHLALARMNFSKDHFRAGVARALAQSM